MVIADLKREVLKFVSQRDTQLLITSLLELSINDYVLKTDCDIKSEDCEKVISAAKRVSNGEPLQYVTGKCEFMSLDFYINEGVLIPRSDTETLVESAIELIGDKRCKVIDICCGSGCIGISIAKYCKYAEVMCVDISESALELTKRNADFNDVDIEINKIDILSEIPNGKFDFIVSNPPYIESDIVLALDRNVRDFEPHLALDGGEDGLKFYRRITGISPILLNMGGIILYEVSNTQSTKVSQILRNTFRRIDVKKDYCGVERVVIGSL